MQHAIDRDRGQALLHQLRRGPARASRARSWPDVSGGARQGASTITQQFVKNALAAQGNRTVFEKLREAALAYHLTRKWPKEKILAEYLNTIYFGNGAYGIESAARDVLRQRSAIGASTADGRLRRRAANAVRVAAADAGRGGAAGAAWSPSPDRRTTRSSTRRAAKARRDLVLHGHARPGLHHADAQYRRRDRTAAPDASTTSTAAAGADRGAVLHQLGAPAGRRPLRRRQRRRSSGGLKIQHDDRPRAPAGRRAGDHPDAPDRLGRPDARRWWRSTTGPARSARWSAALDDYDDEHPFNLATQGQRQPGSAFKPFTLAAALEEGILARARCGPRSRSDFIVPNSGGKRALRRQQLRQRVLAARSRSPTRRPSPTTPCSPSSAAQGRARKQDRADARGSMGIRTPVSTNYAMILGGLKRASRRSTWRTPTRRSPTGGKRVCEPELGAPRRGPGRHRTGAQRATASAAR